jgi:hypothetical protein
MLVAKDSCDLPPFEKSWREEDPEMFGQLLAEFRATL